MTWHLWGIKPAKYRRALKAAAAGSQLLLVSAEMQKDAEFYAGTEGSCHRREGCWRWVLLQPSSSEWLSASAD